MSATTIRAAMVLGGSVLALQGVRVARTSHRTRDRRLGGLFPWAICVAMRLPVKPRAEVATWVAAAPECWPARLIGGASRRSPAVELAHLMRGVRALTGLMAAAVVVPTVLLAGCTLAVATIAGVVLGGSASHLPQLLLRRRAATAMSDAAARSAEAVELLAATTAAGLPLDRALMGAATHLRPPAAAAYRAAAIRRSAGEDPTTLFAEEAARWRMPPLADVGAAVERHHRLGTSLSAELWTIASRLRAETRAAALERAARRGPLATLLVAMVIAPVCVASIAACVIGGLIQSRGGLAP